MYLIVIGNERRFLPMQEAAIVYDCGLVNVSIGELVLEHDYSLRNITPEEKGQIVEMADNYSESK
jgi:hypothetical protein